MRNLAYLIIALIITSGCNNHTEKNDSNNNQNMKSENYIKVTGIGGIFFKCNDPEKTRNWYKENLGFRTNEYGSMFEFRLENNKDEIGYIQWSPFSVSTKYFQPSESDFMVNYRVADLKKLAKDLESNGITILDTIESYEYGSFLHILDPENNKIELWEPIDNVFTGLYSGTTNIETGIGGFMFKSDNPTKLIEWYKENLGFNVDDYGSLFSFQNSLKPEITDYLRWSPMPDSTDYFAPSQQQYMINYRVNDIEVLLKNLKDKNVTVVDSIELTDYGKFVHVLDADGNKIELWEPDFSKLSE
jgi:predicted enzyme related to lactoylglutathione lyase